MMLCYVIWPQASRASSCAPWSCSRRRTSVCCLGVYIYIYVYIHTYIHIHTYMYICVYIYIHISYIYIYIIICVGVCLLCLLYVLRLFPLLDLCGSSLRRGHANILCIVPILTDDPRRESRRTSMCCLGICLLRLLYVIIVCCLFIGSCITCSMFNSCCLNEANQTQT